MSKMTEEKKKRMEKRREQREFDDIIVRAKKITEDFIFINSQELNDSKEMLKYFVANYSRIKKSPLKDQKEIMNIVKKYVDKLSLIQGKI